MNTNHPPASAEQIIAMVSEAFDVSRREIIGRSKHEHIRMARHAVAIADRLRVALGQDSYSIQYPDTTIFHSWRQEQ